MSWQNTPITYRDVAEWQNEFQNAKAVIDHMEERTSGDKEYLKRRMNDALFLVAFIESLLCVEVEGETYDRARELQRENYNERRQDK